MRTAAQVPRRTRGGALAVARALAVGLASVGIAGVPITSAQVPSPRPPLIGDPTGRSSEPPPLFEELPGEVPEPGQILPAPPPAEPRARDVLPPISVHASDIKVLGSTVFTPEELAAVTRPYTGRQVTAEDLEALRISLTRLCIDRGYVNSGAILPDQTVTEGVITYQIVEGKLSATEVEGNRWLRDSYYRARLAPPAGTPLDVTALQERLQILLEDPRIERLNAELKPGARPAEAVLDVRVEERFPLRLWFDVDNYQAPSVGAIRGVVTVEHQSLTGHGDLLTLSYGRSEGLDPLLEASYSVPVTANDTILGIGYRRNDLTVVEEPFDILDIRSASDVYTVWVRHPVYRTPTTTFALELYGEHSKLETSVLGLPVSLEPGAVQGKSAVTAIRFAQEYVHRTRREVIAVRSRFSLGVQALDSTIHDDDDTPDSEFLAWLGQFQWVRHLPGLQASAMRDSYFILRSDVQLSNDQLLTLEQIALGGRYTVRGYPQNTLVRDNAFLASLELRVPIVRNPRWADYLELAPFVDYGRGWNTNRPSGTPRDLSGVGIGVRWALTIPSRIRLRPQLEMYWAHPLREINTTASALEGNGFYFQLLVSVF